MRGFFLNHYARDWRPTILDLTKLCDEGAIKSTVDKGANSARGPFIGLESVVDAVEVSYYFIN